jgi:hypothetical protein
LVFVVTTGDFWSNVILTFLPSNEQLNRTQTWLLRSTPYPLDILLDLRNPDWDREEGTDGFRWSDMEAVLSLLVSTASRWRTIQLLMDTRAPIFTFLHHTRTIDGSLAQLKALTWRVAMRILRARTRYLSLRRWNWGL